MPPAIQVQDGVNFEGAELGVRGGAALSAAQGGDETTLAEIASNTLGLGTVDKLMTAIKDPEVARDIASMDRRTGWGSNLHKVRR